VKTRYGPGWGHPEADPASDIREFMREAAENYSTGRRMPLGAVVLGSFESASRPGTFYTQMRHGDGRISCDCPGYVNHEHCWHEKKRREELGLS
jgi:hypothetical protein